MGAGVAGAEPEGCGTSWVAPMNVSRAGVLDA